MAFQGSAIEYQATVQSAGLTGQAQLSIAEDGIAVTTLFQPSFIDFLLIQSFAVADYNLIIQTYDDQWVFQGLGNLLSACLLELRQAFNQRVLRALFASGEADVIAEGDFSYTENQQNAAGQAQIQLFADAVCLLPDNDQARRIPLVYVNGLQAQDFGLTLQLVDGSSYSMRRLGSALPAFQAGLQRNLHSLRQDAIAAAHQLDGSLSAAQLNAIAQLMPSAVAAPLGALQAIAPSFVAALEQRIASSRAAQTYQYLQSICDPAAIWVGMRSQLAGDAADDVLWLMAPSRTKPVLAVEFATSEDAAAATFIYQSDLPSAQAAQRLNRALESLDFHREVISFTDAELSQAENSVYALAVRRNPALHWARASLVGRVIHASAESWQNQINGYLQ